MVEPPSGNEFVKGLDLQSVVGEVVENVEENRAVEVLQRGTGQQWHNHAVGTGGFEATDVELFFEA